MSSRLEEFDHLKIKMKDILSATNNFSRDKFIGGGGFGPVYKGELSLPGGPTMVAFKRLDPTLGQGNTEFWKEIMMLSKYKHENLVSLLQFGVEGKERVLVYEYVSRGSLDRYLGDPSLTWNQRLDICIGAAMALKYLHDPHETQQRVLHRDIKSSNILLDEKWTAKVSDFGLSKIGPANQSQTFLVSNGVGTYGYCDPLYFETGLLSKESDVYSFGVVLFEVMCGRLCCEYCDSQLSCILVPKWKECCNKKKLDDIIFQDLKEQIVWDSLLTFSSIALRCLERDARKRPTMDTIVKELEVALEQQNNNHNTDLAKISKLAVTPLSYRSQKELISLLSKGILVDEGKRWVSVNENEEVNEMISATQCISGGGLVRRTNKDSRFPNVLQVTLFSDFKVKVRTKLLKPHVTYTINLVFKQGTKKSGIYAYFYYKLEGETDFLKSSAVQEREDGWLMTKLYQFTTSQKEHDFKIDFSQHGSTGTGQRYLEAIQFQPLEKEKLHKNLEDRDVPNMDSDWEQKLSADHFIELSKDKIKWTTKKELYFLLRKGFLINNRQEASSYLWLSISKSMKKRLVIPSKEILLEDYWWRWTFLPESRFKMVARSHHHAGYSLMVSFRIMSELLSAETKYSCCLIYQLPAEDSSLLTDPITVRGTGTSNVTRYLYLVPPPPTPVIRSMVDNKHYASQSHTRNVKGFPNLRKDGWMEIPLYEFSTHDSTQLIRMHFEFSTGFNTNFSGLLIEGIEFRPL